MDHKVNHDLSPFRKTWLILRPRGFFWNVKKSISICSWGVCGGCWLGYIHIRIHKSGGAHQPSCRSIPNDTGEPQLILITETLGQQTPEITDITMSEYFEDTELNDDISPWAIHDTLMLFREGWFWHWQLRRRRKGPSEFNSDDSPALCYHSTARCFSWKCDCPARATRRCRLFETDLDTENGITRWHNLEIVCRGVSQYSYQVLLQYALEVTCLFRAHRRWMSSTYTILWSQANCPIRGLLRSVLNGHIGDCDYIVLFDGLWEEEKCLEISARACATRTAGLIMMWIGVWPSCSRVSDVHRS